MLKKITWAAVLATAITAAVAQEPTDISFEAADKNGDGRVNREEASILPSFDFSRADINQDASLNRPEFQAALATPLSSGGVRQAQRKDDSATHVSFDATDKNHVSFETTDKNKDGRVNRKEASDIPGFDFSAADTNEDASLNRQEFQIALAELSSRG